nr:heme-binding protein [Rhizobium tubonense]
MIPGATPDNTDWAAGKRSIAHRFHRSSCSLARSF